MLQNSSSTERHAQHHHAPKSNLSEHHRRISREEAMAIKAEVDYQRLNKSFTDVTFIVGPPQHSKKYVGHRVLLAMTSPVFETMFYGDMADKNKYIRIPDVAPIGFENLLRYAYTDSLNLGSVEDAMLTAYAAKKYLLPQLLRECLTFIEHNIGPSTACVVFEFAHVLNSQQLVLQAMNLIDRQTNSVIANKSFNHVQATTIEFVANRKYLSLSSEYALFNAIIGWSLSEARRRNLSGDDWSNIRALLSEGSILSAIRFLAMKQEEFARAIAKTSALVEVPAGKDTSTGFLGQATSSQLNGGAVDASELVGSDGAASNIGAGSGSADEPATGSLVGGGGAGSSSAAYSCRVDVNDSNSLLTEAEQRAIFLNLALNNLAKLPPTICPFTQSRQPPPEHFTLKRFRSSGASGSNLVTATTRSIKSISSKFQCLSENVFIVALTIPIRLDVSSYANRTPKFECHLKFITKATSSSPQQPPLVTGSLSPMGVSGGCAAADCGGAGASGHQQLDLNNSSTATAGGGAAGGAGNLIDGSTLLMDTIDESLHISIARDKDCLVRLKRPILIRMGNINELTLTFQTYALDEDIVALRTPKLRSANFSEQTDGENISWLFFKTSNIEFSELHYYY